MGPLRGLVVGAHCLLEARARPPLHAVIGRHVARRAQRFVVIRHNAHRRAQFFRVAQLIDRLPQLGVLPFELGPEIFAQTLRLRVGANGGGDAFAKEANDDEVERANIGEFVSLNFEVARLADQLLEAVDGQVFGQPGVGGVASRPDADIGVPALVAGARAKHGAER